MKRHRKIIGGLFVALASTQVMAGTVELGPWLVSSLRFGTDGLYVRFNPAPASCGGGDQYEMHAKVSSTANNYKEITSALLTAYTVNQPFKYIWVSNEGTCSGAHILELNMVQFEQK